MDNRVSFIIPHIAAAAIAINTFDETVHRMHLGGRVTTARRGGGQYVKCSARAAEHLIDLLLQRAVAIGTTPELLIECSCAVQAIYEVHDPRAAGTKATATRTLGPPQEAIRMVGGSCDGLYLVWDADLKPIYLNSAGQRVPSRILRGVDETYVHTFILTTDAIEKVLSFAAVGRSGR